MSARADRMVNVEPTTCPRRMGGLGPWRRAENLDHWQRGTWAATREEADEEMAEFIAKYPTGSMGNTLWCYPGEQPRTCSFCGGAHPDDILALLDAGWEVGSTDKRYKRYLNPPGYHEHIQAINAQHAAWMDRCEASPDADPYTMREPHPTPRYPSPVPPVKVYVQHFTEAHVAAFNARLAR